MRRIGSLLLLAGLSFSCGGSTGGPLPPGPREPATNLAWLETFADRTVREGLIASWDSSLGGDGSPLPFGQRPLRGLRATELATLRGALRSDEELQRIELVERASFLLKQSSDEDVKTALEQLDRMRAQLSLSDPELHRVLLESSDASARREAWLALHAGSDRLAPLVVALTQARRAWATEQGYQTALQALAEWNGPRPETAQAIAEQALTALQVEGGSPLTAPWNAETFDPSLAARLAEALPAKLAIERGERVSAWLGAAPTALTAGPDLTGFSSNASFPIDPPSDVRVRIAPAAGLAGDWRVFHELGHAAQARLAPAEATPLQQRCRSGAVSEAAAKLAERLAWSPEWLRSVGVSEDDIALVGDWEALSERARGRRILADAAFERVLHEHPGAALDAMHRSAWERIAGLLSPPEVSAWAAQRSFSHDPGERMDYLFARCAQAAIYRRLRAQPGGLLGTEASRLLREEILPSAAGATYEDWFRLSTGENPNCAAWLQDVARLP
jgi:hypothetical protein